MGFFSKVKDKLGIGGVKAVLEVPKSVSKTVDFIEGKIILTTKSEQEITDIEVTLIEDFSIGSDDEKTQKRFELGKVTFNDHFSISPGETKEIPFCLPFAFIKHHMGFRVTKYTGIAKNQEHFSLLATCYNLRRIPALMRK